MLLSYSLSGLVETDTPADQQNGIASIDIDLSGDFSLPQILSISEITELGLSPFSASLDNIAVSFILGANETETISASIFSYGESDSLSSTPVLPVPASALVFLYGDALMSYLLRNKILTLSF